MAEELIAAIATPMAAGGIGVVRISGEDALETAQKLFRAKSGKRLSEMKPYTAAYGHILLGGEPLDECIALVFHGPKSYTGEDVVEFSCHGGLLVMRKVLEAAIRAGARQAGPGEFTKRAFLNGRIDLTRAESVMELIGARNEKALKNAEKRLEGGLSEEAVKLRRAFTDLSSELAAWADYPDEDVPEIDEEELRKKLGGLIGALSKLIDGYGAGKMLREGVKTALVGRPNAGKSTLMNLFSGEEKSIVTDIPGTTRDVVENEIQLGGIPLRLADTAGIRRARDPIEKAGVDRALGRLENCDLALVVFDGSRPLEEEDFFLIKAASRKTAVALLNKSDLPRKADEKTIRASFAQTVEISAKSGKGMEELKNTVASLLQLDENAAAPANERQLDCFLRAKRAAEDAAGAIEKHMTLDAVTVCIDDALAALYELTGERASDRVIERVFERFCVGK